MNDGADAGLSGSERALVEAVWAREARVPARRLHATGCLLAFVGMAVLTLTPAMGNFVDLTPEAAYSLLALAVVLLVGGATVALIGSSRNSASRADSVPVAARAAMQSAALGGEDAVRDATVLLARLHDRGLGSVPLDATDLASRLGPSLPVVRRVETHLVAQGRCVPIFSGSSAEPG